MGETLKEKLFDKKECGWKKISEDEKKKAFEVSDKYMDFLNRSKTEREFVKSAKELANENGFKDLMEFESLNPGDKIYFVNRDKSMYLAVIGQEPIENGMHIIGSHDADIRLLDEVTQCVQRLHRDPELRKDLEAIERYASDYFSGEGHTVALN